MKLNIIIFIIFPSLYYDTTNYHILTNKKQIWHEYQKLKFIFISPLMQLFQTHISAISTSATTRIVIDCLADTKYRLIVTDYFPYFYVRITTNLQEILTQLSNNNIHIKKYETVKKMNIFGYHEEMMDMVRIYFESTSIFNAAKKLLDKNLCFNSKVPFPLQFMVDLDIKGMSYIEVNQMSDFEENIDVEGEFGVNFSSLTQNLNVNASENDKSFQSKNKYQNMNFGIVKYISYKKIEPVSKDALPAFKILSIDIETINRDNKFPDSSYDPIIQIGNTVKYGDQVLKSIFCVRETASIPNVDVKYYENEKDMIIAWLMYVFVTDPDIILGYNICGFDLPYIFGRVKKFNIAFCVCRTYLDRTKDREIFKIIDSRLSNKSKFRTSRKIFQKENTATINVENNETNDFYEKLFNLLEKKFKDCRKCNYHKKDIPIEFNGRIVIDLLSVVKKGYKLRSYTLNNVSLHFLNEQKEDLPYYLINGLFEGDDKTRRRIAIYCLKDTLLPLVIYEKLLVFITGTEMARVLGVPIDWYFNRGISVKIFALILRRAKLHSFVIPHVHVENEGFTGAFVIDPEKGYYDEPIAVLDFNSLYPSIIIAHNLCYTTMVTKHTNRKTETTPIGTIFVTREVRKGLLPDILQDLLRKRKEVRKEMAMEKDPFRKSLLDARQSAFKIAANSLYGFTGSALSSIPCLEIGQSVTGYGREMIIKTKNYIESMFCKDKGYDFDAKIIYGDTDSVMIQFIKEQLTADFVFDVAGSIAEKVSEIFPDPIRLEFEKVYYPYLLMNKKRYAGVVETREVIHNQYISVNNKGEFKKESNIDQNEKVSEQEDGSEKNSKENNSEQSKNINLNDTDQQMKRLKKNTKTIIKRKIDTKGIETVRRDNCKLVKHVIEESLELLLMKRDPENAKNFIKKIIADLYMDKIDMSLLIISKTLSKTNYTAKQAHVELAERIKKRENISYELGDRIAFVIIDKGPGVSPHLKSEDPSYVLQNNLSIDVKYYIEQQLMKPVHRLFDPLMENVNELFVGEHTKNKKKAAVFGPMAKFVNKNTLCLSCRARGYILCKHCKNDFFKVYTQKLKDRQEKEQVFNKCWRECQRCIQSVCCEVFCANRDCPIFFKRTKVITDLKDIGEEIKKLENLEW